jgi:SAM-dependent methyltransferase
MNPDPTTRFSDRVDHYVKFRPDYPPELLPFLEDAIGLTPRKVIADVGSGTGISTELLLKHGNIVHAVEPNPQMRAAAERRLAAYPDFHSHTGTASATGLADASIDLVTAFQAFHWFDPPAAKREFVRILKPGGWVVLVWNDRRTDSTPFLRDYERLLIEYGTDYQRVRNANISPDVFDSLFAPHGYRTHALANEQVFDFEGLRGRLLSSSYAPGLSHPRHEPMLAELRRIFDRHQQEGRVRFIYDTRVYYGRIDGP